MSLGGLLNIGQSALNATQASINTIGNNIANVNTTSYSRQYVRLEDANYLNNKPGAQGQGVNAAEVLRYFNKFIENSFVQKSSIASRWDEQTNHMSSIENIFNEANRDGVSSQMNNYFKSWEELSKGPDEMYRRQDLISNSDSLALLMRDSTESIKQIQQDMDSAIKHDVTRANELIENIAELNKQINVVQIDEVNNANGLMDKRDAMTRELGLLMDVKIDDKGGGDYFVHTKNGMPLVEGTNHYELAILPAQSEFVTSSTSNYKGDIEFSGTDAYEYTINFTQGGDVTDPPGANPPKFTVSLDGGKTLLRDKDNNVIEYEVTGTADPVTGDVIIDPIKIKNLEITFSESNNFTTDDVFAITPKEALYWVEPTRGAINITPQINFNGTDNEDRLTGGTLTALFNVRDDNCGRYLDELDAVAAAIIWETNFQHSQGAGLEKRDYMQGTEATLANDVALGTPQSGLAFQDRLQSGLMVFNIYNKDTGAFIDNQPLDFDGVAGGAVENFDPAIHSLEDVQAAINTTYAGQLTATIIDGKLNIESDPAGVPPVDFHVGKDDTGVLAALGLNTFFQGSNASDISINPDIYQNHNLINAGSVNGGQEVNAGDASTASFIAKLADLDVNISTVWKSSNKQTMLEYYSSVVATVGSDARSAQTNRDYNIALATDLDNQQAATSGVNLDEEMANLIKFQHSYTAAAKLITTADQMLQTLLGLKQ